ncbi:hypothetical protein PRIPAC_78916 [Pristionchus pacificus]|uniref:Uncharacterized protein n=1 Tax=Pristionchus pacificus TaxID=54126 RepID=A0A2A6CJU7_PRIPA|nr:hypothetical protein PRIPAC_78916 [Pristionchus pacificus]|eukprot:PDM78399.1 hypothetical protein PRIPAC_30978 [Pristionchus pacificus]
MVLRKFAALLCSQCSLRGISLLLFLALVPLAHACIPTKTPEPGLPATTTTTAKPIWKLSVPDCKAVIGNQPKTCAEAIFTTDAVSCTAPDSMLVFKTSDTQTEQHAAPLKCVGTEWKLEGFPLPVSLASLPIGCVSPKK